VELAADGFNLIEARISMENLSMGDLRTHHIASADATHPTEEGPPVLH
jgi:hypothetical protein